MDINISTDEAGWCTCCTHSHKHIFNHHFSFAFNRVPWPASGATVEPDSLGLIYGCDAGTAESVLQVNFPVTPILQQRSTVLLTAARANAPRLSCTD